MWLAQRAGSLGLSGHALLLLVGITLWDARVEANWRKKHGIVRGAEGRGHVDRIGTESGPSAAPDSELISDEPPPETHQLKQLRVRASEMRLRQKGVGPPLVGFAQEAQGFAASYRLEEGACYLLLAVADGDLHSLTTSLWGPRAERQATLIGRSDPWTMIRAPTTGTYRLVVRPLGGKAEYAAGLYPYDCPSE